MKVGLPLALTTLALACVPASEKLPPAGAAGFVAEPSLAARGEPFTTEDGWVVRFEKVLLLGRVTMLRASGIGGTTYGVSESYLWNGGVRTELFAPGASVGPWNVELRLDPNYVRLDSSGNDDDVVKVGVLHEDEQRFHRAPDGLSFDRNDFGGLGPNLLLVVRGEKAGRVVALDLAFSATPTLDGKNQALVVVRADAVVFASLGVEPERIFADQDGGVRFEPIVNADADHDGHVTAAELMAAPGIPGSPNQPSSSNQLGLWGTLADRTAAVLVTR